MTISPTVKTWLVDVGERVGSSFGEAVIAAITAGALAKGINATTAHVLLVAGLTAAAATLKGILAAAVKSSVSPASLAPAQQPGQAEQDAPPSDALADVHDRVMALPKPSGRKHGAIPSPLDKRDYRAKLPSFASIPASVNYGLGLVFSMLLNNILGCCYPAALLHALQVLTDGKYVPTDADVLVVYEAMGYDPTKTDANGDNSTDRGTVGRVLFAWAKAKGLIVSYAAVPTDHASIKAAIAAHKAVLCEWALPAGAENEGAKWTMPRSNKAAGSWGYHATVEVGYTSRHTDNVTWGEEGTVTPPFERAYLQAAWIVTVAPGTDVAAIMAKVRAA